MKRLEEMLLENMLIMESNTLRFPKKSEPSKFKLFTSEHCDQRMQERHVSEKELLDAVFGAYKDLNAKYKEKKLKQSYNGEDSRCVIVDARKNKNKPVCVVLFLRHSFSENKLYKPTFICKTVFKGEDFTGATHARDTKGEFKIMLY
jgi:hypothetical protein